QMLTPIHQDQLRDLKKIDYGNPKACRDCPLRARCTNDVRSVSRLENEDALDRMAERVAARPDILDRRREIVEHPFGSIKQWMNQGRLPYARPRKSPRRVQSDRPRLSAGGRSIFLASANCWPSWPREIQTSISSRAVRTTGIAFGWIAPTSLFGSVVRNAKMLTDMGGPKA